MKSNKLFAVGVTLLLLLAAACSSDGTRKAKVCVAGNECESSQGCYQGACVSLCQATCGAGNICVVSDGKEQCVESKLVLKSGSETDSDSTTPADKTSENRDTSDSDTLNVADTNVSNDSQSTDVSVGKDTQPDKSPSVDMPTSTDVADTTTVSDISDSTDALTDGDESDSTDVSGPDLGDSDDTTDGDQTDDADQTDDVAVDGKSDSGSDSDAIVLKENPCNIEGTVLNFSEVPGLTGKTWKFVERLIPGFDQKPRSRTTTYTFSESTFVHAFSQPGLSITSPAAAGKFLKAKGKEHTYFLVSATGDSWTQLYYDEKVLMLDAHIRVEGGTDKLEGHYRSVEYFQGPLHGNTGPTTCWKTVSDVTLEAPIGEADGKLTSTWTKTSGNTHPITGTITDTWRHPKNQTEHWEKNPESVIFATWINSVSEPEKEGEDPEVSQGFHRSELYLNKVLSPVRLLPPETE